MAKLTLQNIPPSHYTCETCHGIMGAIGHDHHGSDDTDIPCPLDMNADIKIYGIAEECTHAEEQE